MSWVRVRESISLPHNQLAHLALLAVPISTINPPRSIPQQNAQHPSQSRATARTEPPTLAHAPCVCVTTQNTPRTITSTNPHVSGDSFHTVISCLERKRFPHSSLDESVRRPAVDELHRGNPESLVPSRKLLELRVVRRQGHSRTGVH